MKTIDFKTISFPGKDKSNEDYILCHKLSHNSIIAILADGMGGLSFGAEAAKIVSESINTIYRRTSYVWHSMLPILPYTENAEI